MDTSPAVIVHSNEEFRTQENKAKNNFSFSIEFGKMGKTNTDIVGARVHKKFIDYIC